VALFALDPEMSADDVLDDLGRILAEMYAGAEDELIREVARRAYRDINLRDAILSASEAAAKGLRYALERNRQLAELAGYRANALYELQVLARQVVGRIRDQNLAAELIDTASRLGEAEAAAQLGMARRINRTTTLNGSSSQATTQLALSLQSRLEEMNQRITRYPVDAYQRIVATTSPNVLLGVSTQKQAQRQAVQSFLAEGITGFHDKTRSATFPNGRPWRIGTYAEMAGRTSVQRAFNDAGIHRMQQSGINLVTIVGSTDACDKCAPWIGKILSTDGTTGTVTLPHATEDAQVVINIAGTVDDARGAGWGHPNDRCKIVAYLAGLTQPQKDFQYDAEAAKARADQRDLEVQIRSAKREVATAGDEVSRQRAKKKVKAKQEELRDFLARTGRPRNSAREQLSFADG
jgi:hypothetical protein